VAWVVAGFGWLLRVLCICKQTCLPPAFCLLPSLYYLPTSTLPSLPLSYYLSTTCMPSCVRRRREEEGSRAPYGLAGKRLYDCVEKS